MVDNRSADREEVIFTNGKNLPFVGFLRVDGTMYRFMGRRELPMQAIATMAYDYESWEGKYTSLRPDEGWEQPDFNDQYWQVNEGAFGTRDRRETRTQWLSTDIWVRREIVDIDPYLLEPSTRRKPTKGRFFPLVKIIFFSVS